MIYDQETDDIPIPGVLIVADSQEEAEEQLRAQGFEPEDMVLALTDDLCYTQ